jgi:hypothetical protein
MTETRIADIIIPEVFADYMAERSLATNRFYSSGVLVTDPLITQKLSGGGETFNIPFWKDLSGDDDIPSETVATPVNSIGTDKQIARRQLREKAWGSNDLAAVLAGADPYEAIGNRVTQYWDTRMQENVLAVAKGVIADNVANDDEDMVVDIAIDDGDSATSANKISATETINAVMKQGDRFDEIVAIGVHSAVFKTMLGNDLIDYVTESDSSLRIPTYMGLRVIIDDGLPVEEGGTSGFKYTSLLFKAGAFAYGESNTGIIPVEVDRDPSLGFGRDLLYTRKQFAIHPAGFAWQEADVDGVVPTNAELATATNWNRVYELKNTGFVALISNG